MASGYDVRGRHAPSGAGAPAHASHSHSAHGHGHAHHQQHAAAGAGGAPHSTPATDARWYGLEPRDFGAHPAAIPVASSSHYPRHIHAAAVRAQTHTQMRNLHAECALTLR
jgi:hypothetical protein